MNDMIPLSAVPDVVFEETGHRPTRQTVYNWMHREWLTTTIYRPFLTTREWVLECLSNHLRSAK